MLKNKLIKYIKWVEKNIDHYILFVDIFQSVFSVFPLFSIEPRNLRTKSLRNQIKLVHDQAHTNRILEYYKLYLQIQEKVF